MPNESLIVAKIQEIIQQPYGNCYRASEAAYHLLGGKKAGYTPMVARYGGDSFFHHQTHWWLRRPDGSMLDITEGQFPHGFPHKLGRGCGFLTKQPSKKAQEIIDAI